MFIENFETYHSRSRVPENASIEQNEQKQANQRAALPVRVLIMTTHHHIEARERRAQEVE